MDAVQSSLRDAGSRAHLAELLAKGADANAIDTSGRSALSLAVRNHDLSSIELLLDKGADVNKRDREQWTPLMNAAYLAARDPKFLPVVQLLLAKGADPNAAKDGTTALHVAVNNSAVAATEAAVVNLLIAGGAKPDGVPAAGPTSFVMAPVTLAAWNGKTAAALALAKGGANLEAPSPGAKTAAQTARDNKHPDLAALLEKLRKKKTAAPVKKGH